MRLRLAGEGHAPQATRKIRARYIY